MSASTLTPDAPAVLLGDPVAGAECCRNCETPRAGAYCHTCSQPFQLGELTLRSLMLGFVVRHLSLEGGLVRTFTELCTRPGAMVRDYLDGRRQRYTHPVGYLAISAAASALVGGFWEAETTRAIAQAWATATAEEKVVGEVTLQAMVAMQRHPLLTSLFLCVFLVPLLRLFFRGQIRTGEAAVFSFYLSGHVLLIDAVLKPLAFTFVANPVDAANNVGMALTVLLWGGAAGGFFGRRISTFLKTGAVLAISLLAVMIAILIPVLVLLIAAEQGAAG